MTHQTLAPSSLTPSRWPVSHIPYTQPLASLAICYGHQHQSKQGTHTVSVSFTRLTCPLVSTHTSTQVAHWYGPVSLHLLTLPLTRSMSTFALPVPFDGRWSVRKEGSFPCCILPTGQFSSAERKTKLQMKNSEPLTLVAPTRSCLNVNNETYETSMNFSQTRGTKTGVFFLLPMSTQVYKVNLIKFERRKVSSFFTWFRKVSLVWLNQLLIPRPGTKLRFAEKFEMKNKLIQRIKRFRLDCS